MSCVADRAPKDVLLLIFGQLTARWLKRVALVCKRWHVVSSDDALWARLIEKHDRSHGALDVPKPKPGECPWRAKAEFMRRAFDPRSMPPAELGPPCYPIGDAHATPSMRGMMWLYCTDTATVKRLLGMHRRLPRHRGLVLVSHVSLASALVSSAAAVTVAAAFVYSRGTLSQFAVVLPPLVLVDALERRVARQLTSSVPQFMTRASGKYFEIVMLVVLLADSFSSGRLLLRRLWVPLYAMLMSAYLNGATSHWTRTVLFAASTFAADLCGLLALHTTVVASRVMPSVLNTNRAILIARGLAWLWLLVTLVTALQ